MDIENMPITVKNEKVENMVREVARLSGCSLTDAIGHALGNQLRQLKQARRAPRTQDVLLEISSRCGALPDVDTRSPEEILAFL